MKQSALTFFRASWFAPFLVSVMLLSCARGPNTIVVGSKAFTESYIMSSMASLLLQEEGYSILERFGVGSMIAREALLANQIDIYPEYTGTGHTLYLDLPYERGMSQEAVFDQVKNADHQNDIIWLSPTRINNSYALAIRTDDVGKIGTTMSELSEYNSRNPGLLTFGIDHEFYERPDGFKQMARYYDLYLEPKQIRTMDVGLSFESIAREQIDVAMVYTTDGKLRKFKLTVLADDRSFFPIYQACFVMHRDALVRHPEVSEILAPLGERLDIATMQELNYQVDGQSIPALQVARRYLLEQQLLSR
jgi:osmoprotectant transport system substrate-binding protein